ncbi:MAG TPA: hypothetical protein VIU61_19055 [Kofleriaceae bacterium]
MKLAVALVFAIGCGGSKPAQEPEPAKPAMTCAAMASHVTAMLRLTADESTQVAAIYELRCTEDRWQPEARECFGTMTVDRDVIKCDKFLDSDQRLALTKAGESVKASPPAQDALAKFEEFATRACACKAGDNACAHAVSDDMTKWAESQGADAPTIKPDDPKVQEIASRLTECITKAMMPIEPAPAAAPAAKPAPERKTRGGAKKKPVPKSSSDPDLGGE